MNKQDKENFEKWCMTCREYYECDCVLRENSNQLEKMSLYRAKRKCSETSISRVRSKVILTQEIWMSIIRTIFAMLEKMTFEEIQNTFKGMEGEE